MSFYKTENIVKKLKESNEKKFQEYRKKLDNIYPACLKQEGKPKPPKGKNNE